MSTSIHPLRLAGILAADGTALVVLRPDWSALVIDLRHPHGWVAQVGADYAAATVTAAALWLCAALLGLGFLLTALTVAPGWLGAVARRLADRIVPAAVLRVAATALGISIGLGVVGSGVANAASTASTANPAPSATSSASGASSTSSNPGLPAWPSSSSSPSSPSSPSAPSPPAPSWPMTPVTTVTPTPPATPLPGPGAAVNTAHLVRPGENLWTIAAAALASANPGRAVSDQQIAAQVRAWYGANREVIGANPSLLHPGQQLQAPAPKT